MHTSNDLESVKVCSFSDLAHHNTEQVWLIRNAAQVQRRSEGRREHTGSCDTTVPLSKGEKQQLQTLPFSVFFFFDYHLFYLLLCPEVPNMALILGSSPQELALVDGMLKLSDVTTSHMRLLTFKC